MKNHEEITDIKKGIEVAENLIKSLEKTNSIDADKKQYKHEQIECEQEFIKECGVKISALEDVCKECAEFRAPEDGVYCVNGEDQKLKAGESPHQIEASELEYIRQDEFLIYIQDKVNPARIKAGLNPVGEIEAMVCYRIIRDFNKQWSSDNE